MAKWLKMMCSLGQHKHHGTCSASSTTNSTSSRPMVTLRTAITILVLLRCCPPLNLQKEKLSRHKQ